MGLSNKTTKNWLTSLSTVDGEKLRAVLLINPTKSTLLPILNQGEVGPKTQGRPPVSGSTGNQYFFNLLQSNFPASHLALNRLNQTQEVCLGFLVLLLLGSESGVVWIWLG